jgi:hypothetical protein
MTSHEVQPIPHGWMVEENGVRIEATDARNDNGTVRVTLIAKIGALVRFTDKANLTSEIGRKRVLKSLAANGVILPEQTLIALDQAFRTRSDDANGEAGANTRKPTQAEGLIGLAADLTLFHDPHGEPFVVLPVDGHEETHPLMTKAVRRFLARRYFEAHRKSVSSQASQDALTTLAGEAIFAGEEHAVHVRFAEHEDDVYIDLGDEHWQVTRVDVTGWQVIAAADCPVRFRRPKGMLPLPVPQPGGSIDLLKQFVNIRDEHWPLLVAWLIGALRPAGPYWVLAVTGEQGSAKSTLLRILRALVDPNTAAIRSLPREERDLVIAAANGWTLCFDNASSVPVWLSDALCRLATGGGFATRTLYENDEETIFNAMRPVALNGIEDVVNRGDLADRAITLATVRIDEKGRKTEKELMASFERERPRILGALLTAVSAAIRNLPTTHLSRLPRMADAALWVVAAESALGWTPGTFMHAYTANRSEASTLVLEDSPVAQGILILMGKHEAWEGSASDLLKVLTQGKDEKERQREGWPKKANGLSGTLRRLAPNLSAAGVDVFFGRDARGRTITLSHVQLERDGESSSPSSPSSSIAAHPQAAQQLPLLAKQNTDDGGAEHDDLDDDDRQSTGYPSSSDIPLSGNASSRGDDDHDGHDDHSPLHSEHECVPLRAWAVRAAQGAEAVARADAVAFCKRHAPHIDVTDVRAVGRAVGNTFALLDATGGMP